MLEPLVRDGHRCKFQADFPVVLTPGPADATPPRLDRALVKASRRGGEAVLIDGTLIPTHRTGKDDRKNHSGKHKRHGLRFLALTDECI
ncbi:transposase [Streptosporangium sp. NPDC004379]|uniref:transposase n=1 Tax=Streptosporangium sp. NPDC004379 TaxID=3366189 RepID=UPI00368B701E